MAKETAAIIAPGHLAGVLVFGAVSNLLLLSGPLFMLQVYDRVLPAQSTDTLVALLVLVAGLHLAMAGLDGARAVLLLRLGARLRKRFEGRLFRAAVPPASAGGASLRDLDHVERFVGSAAAGALLDLPWMPVFLLILWLVHPLLGGVALAGGLALIALAAGSALGQSPVEARGRALSASGERLVARLQDLGPDHPAALSSATLAEWHRLRDAALIDALAVGDRAARLAARARSLRLFLQSAILAAGAWLVLHQAMSAGMMVAASILMGRALAPVEVLAGQSALLGSTWSAFLRLRRLRSVPADPVLAPEPGASLVVRDLVVLGETGAPILRLGGFSVPPGRALAVIGPPGAGKTVLARVLTGGLQPVSGILRLGSVPLARLDRDRIGLLPQRPGLLAVPIGAAIARHGPAPPQEAARLAGAQALIEALPAGYDTPADPALLPARLLHRIALARALHGDPALVVLDDPLAQSDPDAADRLRQILRHLKARGVPVVVMAGSPAGIDDCEDLLVLESGRQVSFGPRERVVNDPSLRPGRRLAGGAAP